jgi:hypothetical protein
VAIANGGNLTYYGGVTNGYVLTWNTVSNTWIAAPAGVGDVVGPASAEDNVVVRFNLTTGKLIQGGTNAPTYDDTGNLNLRAGNSVRLYNASGVNYVGLRSAVGTGTYNLTLPTSAGVASQILYTDGPGGNLYWGSGGTGDVVGPALSTDNAIVRWDLATGKLIQNSGVIISDANSVSGAASVYAGFFAISSGAATTGGLRLAHSSGVYSMNHGGAGNIRLINVQGVSDIIYIGDGTNTSAYIYSSASFGLNIGGTLMMGLSAEEFSLRLTAATLPVPVAASGVTYMFKYRDTFCLANEYGRSTIGSINLDLS